MDLIKYVNICCECESAVNIRGVSHAECWDKWQVVFTLQVLTTSEWQALKKWENTTLPLLQITFFENIFTWANFMIKDKKVTLVGR
jgi:hypothetical protein